MPVDFPAPLESKLLTRVPGYFLGSSIRLLQELRELAPPLGLQDAALSLEVALDESKLPEDEIESLANDAWSREHTFAIERPVWFIYFLFAYASTRYKTIIMIE